MQSPNLEHVLRRAIQFAVASIFKVRTGSIDKFDSDTQLASVRVEQKETYEDNEGSTVAESLPIVQNVPCVFLGGKDGLDTFPVAKGDECLILIADRSLDLWIEKGGVHSPGDTPRNDITDAIAIVGIRSKPNKLSEFDQDRKVIGKKAGAPRIAFADSVIHLGVDHQEDATENVILGKKYTDDEKSALQSAAGKLSAAQTLLTSAGVSLTAAAAANAPPFVGGAASAGAFVATAQLIIQAATQIGQAATDLNNFAGGMAARLSNKVKVK